MRKRRGRFWLWMIVILGICCAGMKLKLWETHQNEQQTVIIDMIGDKSERELAKPDADTSGHTFSIRLVVDACGLVLILLGIVLFIHAIISWQNRYLF